MAGGETGHGFQRDLGLQTEMNIFLPFGNPSQQPCQKVFWSQE